MNRVVARYQDGRSAKGMTNDFFPNKDRFHLLPADAPPGTKPVEILVAELKAVFFVKEFAGNPGHKKTNAPEGVKPPPGRKVQVTFKDAEVIVGTTQGYQAGRPGFFLVPIDPESNNERCYVVSAAAKDIKLL
jgi:hypothetical protein